MRNSFIGFYELGMNVAIDVHCDSHGEPHELWYHLPEAS